MSMDDIFTNKGKSELSPPRNPYNTTKTVALAMRSVVGMRFAPEKLYHGCTAEICVTLMIQ